jgi:hypothetical protein
MQTLCYLYGVSNDNYALKIKGKELVNDELRGK